MRTILLPCLLVTVMSNTFVIAYSVDAREYDPSAGAETVMDVSDLPYKDQSVDSRTGQTWQSVGQQTTQAGFNYANRERQTNEQTHHDRLVTPPNCPVALEHARAAGGRVQRYDHAHTKRQPQSVGQPMQQGCPVYFVAPDGTAVALPYVVQPNGANSAVAPGGLPYVLQGAPSPATASPYAGQTNVLNGAQWWHPYQGQSAPVYGNAPAYPQIIIIQSGPPATTPANPDKKPAAAAAAQPGTDGGTDAAAAAAKQPLWKNAVNSIAGNAGALPGNLGKGMSVAAPMLNAILQGL